ncbi:uncharacterized protein BDR25DRAFT_306469 [Lindgomyces ingoldianus]|uniref:Uncharacterized protein n=1 Tax=Lindgomyces ingoldianus TaxID=673940 RepID=A0ACB6QIQ8_9PLEO|nr:uncharacterized protein BDR25DRAFT_306469 [Lindgomyces ingoldianus]KAF2466025.1 hypothetical protein BDR25DRAFT_306469 [Lindgomyces ingoldianus]
MDLAAVLSRAPQGTRLMEARILNPEALLPASSYSKHGQKTANRRSIAYHLLMLGVPIPEVIIRSRASRSTVYDIHQCLMKYGTITHPRTRRLGRPPRLTPADREALFNELVAHGWMYQDEMKWWLYAERGVLIN